MPQVNCPHCSRPMTVAPELVGIDVACPHCSRTLSIPRQGTLESAPVIHTTPSSAPTMIVVESTKPQPRVDAGGWFSRGFNAALGITLAIVLVVVGVPTLLTVLCWGGCFAITAPAIKEVARQEEEASNKRVARAKKFLKPYGITEVATGVVEIVDFSGEADKVLVGKAKYKGRTVDFEVGYNTATFGNVTENEVVYVAIDGERVAGKKRDDFDF
jgi:hypothetical protein